jgi:tetratricopeptide (TPR) repeat protein
MPPTTDSNEGSLGYWELGRVHEAAGRDDEAEAAYGAGIAAGDVVLNVALGELLSGVEGRAADAEAACRAAIAAGFGEAWWTLGDVLAEQAGREAEAEQALLEALDYEGESATLLLSLGFVLQSIDGREREAPAWFRRAIAAGHPYGWAALGEACAAIGDDAGAEAALAEGAAAGDRHAKSDLAHLLARLPDREADAEAAFRVSIAAGESDDWIGFGFLLQRWPGREEEAGEAFRGAIEAGHLLDGNVFLAGWHAARGRPEEAERILRREAELDFVDAWLHLGDLLAKLDRRDEAEGAFRTAIENGQPAGHAFLARLLADDPERQAEAERSRRIAFEAGHTNAAALDEIATASISF